MANIKPSRTNLAFHTGVQYACDWLADNRAVSQKAARMHFINVASDLDPEEPDMALEGMLQALSDYATSA